MPRVSDEQRFEVEKKQYAALNEMNEAHEKYVATLRTYHELSNQFMCDHPDHMVTVETLEMVMTKCEKCGYEWMD